MPLDETVQPGDPLAIKAETWNALMSGLRKFRQSKDRVGIVDKYASLIRSNLDCLVYNAVGDDLFGMYRVVRLGDPSNEVEGDPLSTLRKICLNGLTPNDVSNAFAILQQPLDEDEIGKGVFQGLTLAFVMLNDVSHGYANPIPGNTHYLDSTETGTARILWTGNIDASIAQGLLDSTTDSGQSWDSNSSGSPDNSGSSDDDDTSLGSFDESGMSNLRLALLMLPGIKNGSGLGLTIFNAADSGPVDGPFTDVTSLTFYQATFGDGSAQLFASNEGGNIVISAFSNMTTYDVDSSVTVTAPKLYVDSAGGLYTDGTYSPEGAYLAGLDASVTQKGMISTSAQDFAGMKGFDRIKVYDASNTAFNTQWFSSRLGTDGILTQWDLRNGAGTYVGSILAHKFDGGSVLSFAVTDGLTGSATDAIYSVYVDGTYYNGISVTDPLGNKFRGGILYEVGTGSVGTGTVTTISIVTAHGFAGTVATATTTPAITLSTTVTGILKGDGTSMSAATADVDYATPAGVVSYVSANYQPLDATLTALAGANWSANSLAIGSGTDTVTQVSFAANTFPARASTGNLVAKTISDFILTLVDDADATTARSTLGLVIGTNVAAFAHTHAAADIVSGTIATARLGSGTADATTFLRGDQSWHVPASTLDIDGLTEDTPAYAYEIPMYRTSATVGNKKTTFGKMFGVTNLIPGGRLVLADSSNPIAESTGSNALYYIPYLYDGLPLWDGTRYQYVAIGSHVVTGAVLSGLTSGKPYDVFGYLSSGALATEILIWTNSTTRATALTRSNTIWYKAGDQTRMWLGSFYTTGTTTTADTPGSRYVSNAFNRVPYCDWSFDSTDTWTNSGNGTFSAMNSSNAAWIHNHMIGVAAEPIIGDISISGVSGTGFVIMTYDGSTTLDRAVTSIGAVNAGATATVPSPVFYSKVPAEGKHSVTAMQTSYNASSVTFYGDGGTFGSGVYGQNNGMRIRGWR